eukprot:CAMPEP_0183537342 /NCGR_PEP_ID=MMETSP0371-20130417/28861_1 /TAXON_ID=268820 /ORGANISM="Peridinium aciculiferum, Strain PAER-2" /LENGTH=174 /DNA_ID=CAMNT_0025738051 /DNA_START=109 /DNA_END=633 /DNA_ORIENTATION=+
MLIPPDRPLMPSTCRGDSSGGTPPAGGPPPQLPPWRPAAAATLRGVGQPRLGMPERGEEPPMLEPKSSDRAGSKAMCRTARRLRNCSQLRSSSPARLSLWTAMKTSTWPPSKMVLRTLSWTKDKYGGRTLSSRLLGRALPESALAEAWPPGHNSGRSSTLLERLMKKASCINSS